MARHILPGVLPLAIVMFVNAAQRFMLMGVGLGFLGLGDPSVVDWGSNDKPRLFQWWLCPGIMVVASSAWFGSRFAVNDPGLDRMWPGGRDRTEAEEHQQLYK
jgi:hypothetical protein